MRGLLAVAGAAALAGSALGQVDSKVYNDPETGFTFAEYVNDKGIAFRTAVPADAKANDNYDAVVQIAVPKSVGWAGLAWGGSMTYNPLTIVWANGNNTVLSSREAFGYYVPPPYDGATYTVLKKGTHVNATHYQVTAKCTGCTLWGDSDTGITSIDPTTQSALAFAYAAAPVTNPASNTSSFSIHDLIGHWIHDFSTAKNADFTAKVSKNSEGTGNGRGGNPGPSNSTTNHSTTTAKTTTTPSPTSHQAASVKLDGSSQLDRVKRGEEADALPFPANCSGVPATKFHQVVADGWKFTKIGGGMYQPRQIVVDSLGNIIVVQNGYGISVHTFGPDGCINSTSTLVQNQRLNHGLDLTPDGKTLYASSLTTVWRWDYDAATRKVSNQTVVIKGMNNGGHPTRALFVVPQKPQYLIVQLGANSNWDYPSNNPATARAIIKGFDLSQMPAGGYDYVTGGYNLGYGQRNGVGIAIDPSGMAWEVENSVDDLTRTHNGQATDIHLNNPAEELNFLGDPTKPSNTWYGYPYCISAWDAKAIADNPDLKTGDHFVPAPNSTWTDADCAKKAQAPRLTFMPHSAPISALFDKTADNMYVTFHGSWDRQPATGYKLVEVPFKNTNGTKYEPAADATSTTGYKDIFWNRDTGTCSDQNCFRPTGLAWDRAHSRLFMLSDSYAEGELYILAKK